MAELIERKVYIDQIKGFVDSEQIKVITGIRRCGKSEVLKLIKQEILKKTDEEHIIFLNFEDYEHVDLLNPKNLHDYIISKIKNNEKYYVFLDEIQKVEDWEKVVSSLRLRNTDIYITGSNAQLLSGELATLIAGRYVSFEIHTLSFSEFLQFRKTCLLEKSESFINDEGEIYEYIKIGGFPLLSTKSFTQEEARKIIIDIESSAVLKDVVERNKIKNVPLLQRIIAFVYDNVGSLISLTKIANYLKSNGGGADFETISSYIGYLENACIIKKVSRYDIKGKKLLESNDKYYLADHSLQYTIREMKKTNISGILENIVYNELIRRGYKVYVGKMSGSDDREIDFIAEKNNGDEKIYVQVCYEYGSKETMDREFTPLTEIKDHFPKYVVTLDKLWNESRNGVTGIHLTDFLLKEL
ncbi:MAG: ATP-binding protein [Treponema sp.]|nr:ATP-binding protein [Treponema sp.]